MNAPLTLAEMHYRLGQFLKGGDGIVYWNGPRWRADRHYLEGLSLDCTVRASQPAPSHFDRAFAERLQAKWDAEGAAYDAHRHDKAALTAALAQIDREFGE